MNGDSTTPSGADWLFGALDRILAGATGIMQLEFQRDLLEAGVLQDLTLNTPGVQSGVPTTPTGADMANPWIVGALILGGLVVLAVVLKEAL